MAIVIECDLCKKLEKDNKTFRVDIRKRYSGRLYNGGFDVCEDCKDKILEMFENE